MNRWYVSICTCLLLGLMWTLPGGCGTAQSTNEPGQESTQDAAATDKAAQDTPATDDATASDTSPNDTADKDAGVQEQAAPQDQVAPQDQASNDTLVTEPSPDAAQHESPTDQTDTAPDKVASAAGCGKAESTVSFQTTDSVSITADYWPASSADRGAVVLVHMIPPNYNRTSYPKRVRTALQALDLTVINIDRRGAGSSGGKAQDAYLGSKTTLDVEATLAYILDPARQCPINTQKIVLIGASNGTTSVFDTTINRQDKSLPAPAALIWLSPGEYTEQQNKISQHSTALKALPVLIVHPSNEPWSRQYANFSNTWRIVEMKDGAHGTNNFLRAGSIYDTTQTNEIVDWLKKHAN